jgi:hypothetical protein
LSPCDEEGCGNFGSGIGIGRFAILHLLPLDGSIELDEKSFTEFFDSNIQRLAIDPPNIDPPNIDPPNIEPFDGLRVASRHERASTLGQCCALIENP